MGDYLLMAKSPLEFFLLLNRFKPQLVSAKACSYGCEIPHGVLGNLLEIYLNCLF